jgi:hypothetical protein
MKNILIVILALLCFSETFSQGKIDGFYRGKGNITAVLGFGFEDGQNYFTGTEKTDISRSLYYTNIYGSYGIADNFDVSVSIPYLVSNKNRDFQDILLFAKYRVYQAEVGNGNLQLSLASGFSTPVSAYAIGGLNDIGQQATVIEGRAVAHYHWTTGWFATLQSGYSLKLEETPNSIPFVLKVGKTTAKWYYDFYYDYQHSFGGIDYRGTPSPQNFKELGADFHKIGGSVYTSFSESFGAYVSLSYVLSGRNVFQGPGYGLGLVYNFRKKTLQE